MIDSTAPMTTEIQDAPDGNRSARPALGSFGSGGFGTGGYGGADAIVPVALNGGRVTSGFRDALFSTAARCGISVNELVLRATAEKLHAAGEHFSGVFHPGDFTGSVR